MLMCAVLISRQTHRLPLLLCKSVFYLFTIILQINFRTAVMKSMSYVTNKDHIIVLVNIHSTLKLCPSAQKDKDTPMDISSQIAK